ncbi:MAG: multifunctional CCA addition/repair protein [bacterium]
MKTYLVGGAVRDKLLEIPVKERDFVVVGSSPEEMVSQGFKPVGKDFPVFLHPETGEEYALARKERKEGHGYGGFVFHTSPDISLEDDLLRRDLTINAIAEDQDGNLIDPYGGVSDIENRVLRHVSGAFIEDPLRVLRVARFAARFSRLGFSIAPDTLALMAEISDSGELGYLASERVWGEIEQAFSEGSPTTFIQVLRDCGALAKLLPEVDVLFGIPQRADYHPEIDTGIHTLMALAIATEISDQPEVRFAVLMHDLGKGVTPKDILPRHIGHEEAGVPLIKSLCDRLKVPNRFRDLAILTSRFHLLAHAAKKLRPATLLKMLGRLDAWRRPERFEQFLLACEADARGRKGHEESTYEVGDWLRNVFFETSQISPQPFVDAGLTGTRIGEAIHEERMKVVKNLIASAGK